MTYCILRTTPPCSYLISEMKSLSRVRLFATPWTVAHQAPLSMGFSRQEYWSGLPFPSPNNTENKQIAYPQNKEYAEIANVICGSQTWLYIRIISADFNNVLAQPLTLGYSD